MIDEYEARGLPAAAQLCLCRLALRDLRRNSRASLLFSASALGRAPHLCAAHSVFLCFVTSLPPALHKLSLVIRQTRRLSRDVGGTSNVRISKLILTRHHICKRTSWLCIRFVLPLGHGGLPLRRKRGQERESVSTQAPSSGLHGWRELRHTLLQPSFSVASTQPCLANRPRCSHLGGTLPLLPLLVEQCGFDARAGCSAPYPAAVPSQVCSPQASQHASRKKSPWRSLAHPQTARARLRRHAWQARAVLLLLPPARREMKSMQPSPISPSPFTRPQSSSWGRKKKLLEKQATRGLG